MQKNCWRGEPHGEPGVLTSARPAKDGSVEAVRMGTGELTSAPDLSIAEVTERIRAGELSALALTDAYLARIEALDESLNVHRAVTADAARTRAAEIDEEVSRGEDPGPLAGVPMSLKDNIEVAGVPMTAATPSMSGNVAESDAHVTTALRRAGAVLLGKLHMSEWAIGGTTQNVHFGPGHNPWDPTRLSGGSSGGSAAAIAADLALATLGTDTGGSIRLPASLCGAVGLRPTSGRVSNRGSVPVAWSFDTIGPLARRAEDIAAVLGVIAGYDSEDPACEDVPVDDYTAALARGTEGVRIGVLRGSFRGEPLTSATAAALDRAAAVLEGLGVRVEEVLLPSYPAVVDATADMLLAEAAAFHEQRLAERPDEFAPDVLARLRKGEAVSGPRYAAGRHTQRRWRREVLDVLERHDALLAPGCPFPAPLISESEPVAMTGLLAHFSSIWTLAGTPAMVVPVGLVDGLPVAMQLIGRPFDEATLLRVAHAYQQVTDWHLRRPEIAVAVNG
jgi:aspartyl-tRNA(Asn)/glutamyl-tRNA(Gln) amidotransferase subunit A